MSHLKGKIAPGLVAGISSAALALALFAPGVVAAQSVGLAGSCDTTDNSMSNGGSAGIGAGGGGGMSGGSDSSECANQAARQSSDSAALAASSQKAADVNLAALD
ncbi:MAG: hypothetical protein JO023_02925, partial [Chloroflexi bacterium]|nr:hypothetical protein [Chloroflexota bacterium]